MDGIEITWLGHGSFRMRTPEGRIIYLDPWIEGNPACPISLDEVRAADIVCVTHGHDDHLGDSLEIVEQTEATLVSLPEICIYASRHGIEYDKGGRAIHIRGTTRVQEVEITAVSAAHSSDILGVEFAGEGRVMASSGCCGFVIRTPDGSCLYFSGDTGVFQGHGALSRTGSSAGCIALKWQCCPSGANTPWGCGRRPTLRASSHRRW